MTATFDRAKCAQRNRLAARRDGVNAVPFRFLRAAPAAAQEAGLRYAHGALPVDEEAALARINALLPDGVPALTADDVYIHYAEAANTAFIADRWMFLTTRTVRYIARDAAVGQAFMNSHRTGTLSHPPELPYGKTFCGRYEEYADGTARAIIGFYMLKFTYPNGAAGPSTDDLHRQIQGGTLADVSVGLYGGEKLCDVCGGDVSDMEQCPHVPGTTHKLTADDQAAQQARGVPDGKASYSLDGAHMGELSGVFDGAIPGAGFQKALRLARAGALLPPARAEAQLAYATLSQRGDFEMDDIMDAIERGFDRLGERWRGRPALPEPVLTELAAAAAPLVIPPPERGEVEHLQAQLTALAAERQEERAAWWATTARAFADRQVAAGTILPRQHALLTALYQQLLIDDAGQPITLTVGLPDGRTLAGGREAVLAALVGGAAPHTLTGQAVPAGAQVLSAAGRSAEDEAIAAEQATAAKWATRQNQPQAKA